ncbi:MAG: nitrilase-related carbon-nitrogen hydrolase [Actinomycetota bacterium]
MTLELAAIQHDIIWETPAATMAAVRPVVLDAAADGAQLISLTEMWSCGFSMNTAVVAEQPDGPTASFMHELAAETGSWIAGSFPEHTVGRNRPTNRFLLAGPNGEDHRYSKTKPFSYAGETDHYDGGAPVESIMIEGVRVTPFICYDLRFTDLFWNAAAETDLYLVPANWPAVRREHWMTLLRARAIENQAYVCGVNRVGAAGDGLEHSGDSRIFDPLGDPVVEAPAHEPYTMRASIDPAMVADVRSRFRFMNDR